MRLVEKLNVGHAKNFSIKIALKLFKKLKKKENIFNVHIAQLQSLIH